MVISLQENRTDGPNILFEPKLQINVKQEAVGLRTELS